MRDFLPSDFVIRWLADYVCSEEDLDTFCEDIVFVICGFDKKQLNRVSWPFLVERISSLPKKKKSRYSAQGAYWHFCSLKKVAFSSSSRFLSYAVREDKE